MEDLTLCIQASIEEVRESYATGAFANLTLIGAKNLTGNTTTDVVNYSTASKMIVMKDSNGQNVFMSKPGTRNVRCIWCAKPLDDTDELCGVPIEEYLDTDGKMKFPYEVSKTTHDLECMVDACRNLKEYNERNYALMCSALGYMGMRITQFSKGREINCYADSCDDVATREASIARKSMIPMSTTSTYYTN